MVHTEPGNPARASVIYFNAIQVDPHVVGTGSITTKYLMMRQVRD